MMCMLVIPAPGKLRQEHHKFKASLNIASLGLNYMKKKRAESATPLADKQ